MTPALPSSSPHESGPTLPATALIVVAGGSGSRLGGTPKQLRQLGAHPVWLWSVLRLESLVDEIVVVMPKDVQEATRSILEAHIQTSYCVVAGGPSRQASVDCGIRASQAEYLLIHDAARPFISFDDGQHLLQQLRAHPDRVAILADRCTATVKTIDSATHCVTGGIPRESLALASTPQGLSRHIWQQFTPGDQATDEAGRAEKIGVPVDVVWAEHPNPKITSVSDWRLAEALKHLL